MREARIIKSLTGRVHSRFDGLVSIQTTDVLDCPQRTSLRFIGASPCFCDGFVARVEFPAFNSRLWALGYVCVWADSTLSGGPALAAAQSATECHIRLGVRSCAAITQRYVGYFFIYVFIYCTEKQAHSTPKRERQPEGEVKYVLIRVLPRPAPQERQQVLRIHHHDRDRGTARVVHGPRGEVGRVLAGPHVVVVVIIIILIIIAVLRHHHRVLAAGVDPAGGGGVRRRGRDGGEEVRDVRVQRHVGG